METNLIKRICKELGLNYGELGESIGYSGAAIKKAVQTNKVSDPMQKAIELYVQLLSIKENKPELIGLIFVNEEHCESIVNRVCIEFGFSQKKLADMLDVSEPTIAKWNKGEIPKMANLALGLLLENKKLKEDLEEFTLLKKTLKKVGSLFFSSEN